MYIINIISIFSVLLYLNCSSALYFHIGETERKCFIEDVPVETNVSVNYRVELYEPKSGGLMSSNAGMHVEVRDPDDKILLSRVNRSEETISFTSHTHGKHIICMYSNSSTWCDGSQLRVHLDIQADKHTDEDNEDVQKEKLAELQSRVLLLFDQVDKIAQEQNSLRYREERFRKTNENTNLQVLWWLIAQIIILVTMGARQMKLIAESKQI